MSEKEASAKTDEQIIKDLIEILEWRYNENGNLSAAKEYCLGWGFSTEVVELALKRLDERRKIFENFDPAPIASDKRLKWYHGPNSATARYWPDYVKRLQTIRWTDHMIDTLDKTTSRTVDLLDPPGNPEFATRGLVVGRVQSGKTAHFTGVIAKSADCGYRLFIVLSGITNSLRLQTQKRLERDLVNPERSGVWNWLTKREIFGDFETQPAANADVCLRQKSLKSIAVVKKQSIVLRRLIEWFSQGNAILRRNCAVLVIDDEADQASVNTSKSMEEKELTRINSRIVDLLGLFPRCGYVGYTATPFANVLIHPNYPNNLYPRSFIYPLDPPEEYFGAERIHGRMPMSPDEPDEVNDGLPLVRTVPDSELVHLKPKGKNLVGFEFQVTPALEMSLRYFFLATAARLFREAEGSRAMDFSTMLIHTSQRVEVHRQTEIAVRETVKNLCKEVKGKHLYSLKLLWESEMALIDRNKLDAKLGEVEFQDLSSHLFAAIDRCRIIVSNSMQNEEVNVTFEEKGQIMIVIGGNTLSRGLTLEGLVVSFFVRSANAYDTILQMGRWFGYRSYYEDLPRIWMTSEMQDHFHDLATIDQEFREHLDEYQAKGLTPLDAAMRIRCLPKIKITAPCKMRFAVTCQVTYRGERPQTIYFKRLDREWLDGNIKAAWRLISGLGIPVINNDERRVWRAIPGEEVLRFLQEYKFHERARELDAELLTKYIRRKNERDALLVWNVVLFGLEHPSEKLGTVRLRSDIEVNCIKRTRLSGGDEQTANIKALMSPPDILADKDEYESIRQSGLKAAALFDRRKDDPAGVLILYPISKDSCPKDASKGSRLPLAAVQHIIGVAMVFPDPGSGQFDDADYVQADLAPIESTISAEEDEGIEGDTSVG